MNLIKTDEYKSLVDDVQSLLTEKILELHNFRIGVYHSVGKRVSEDKLYKKFSKGNASFVNELARNIKISSALLYDSILFYEKNPDLEKFLLSQPKNLSWHKVRGLLHGTEQKTEEEIKTCSHACPIHPRS